MSASSACATRTPGSVGQCAEDHGLSGVRLVGQRRQLPQESAQACLDHPQHSVQVLGASLEPCKCFLDVVVAGAPGLDEINQIRQGRDRQAAARD